jgi:hypothetical protein
MKHVILRNPSLNGWEHGTLRALEEAIRELTGAIPVDTPRYNGFKWVNKLGFGTRYETLRALCPKKTLRIETDVIWYVLMGPENYELDLFQGWDTGAKYRIVYLFDTLESQIPLIKKLFSGDTFTHCFTSFRDAVPMLEKQTGRKWYSVEQAVPGSLFYPVPMEEKIIHFSSYGRRQERFHLILSGFCRSKGLIYDYTTHGRYKPVASEEELYRQYAWHIRHSLFAVSWPVELTHPQRAGSLSPITCRWFEAASAAATILGHQPANPDFESVLAPGYVINIDLNRDDEAIWEQLNDLWENRKEAYERSLRIALANKGKWTWQNRVKEMLMALSIKE